MRLARSRTISHPSDPMPQFDVYLNPGKRTARAYPFLIVLQSDRWAATGTRLAAPLVLRSAMPLVEVAQSVLTPVFNINGREVFLNPFDVTPVPLDRLVKAVASLGGDSEAKRRIQNALDEVLSPF
jgi:toxin CcdB